MLKAAAILCLFAVMLACIGCSEQAKLNLPVNHTEIAMTGDCPHTPACFFERYPENWENALYQRQVAARYEQKRLARK